jgi:hypothetical protein
MKHMMSDFDFIFCLLSIFIYGSDFIANIMDHISAGHIELRLTAAINRLD